MKDINIRGNLTRFKRGLEDGKVKIGFAGGSITTATAVSNWPTYVRGWFVDRFKDVRLTVVNSAIGATGSLCALSLAKKEFIDTSCDLVFVEYAVNDNGIDSDERMRTREGLIRKLLAANIDVVIVYTFYQNMFGQADKGEVPDSIADFEKLAEHYSISSVYMANAAYDRVKRGIIPWNMWLPDGTHPQNLGSYFYAERVIEYLESELLRTDNTEILKGDDMPGPVHKMNWQNTVEISFDEVKTQGAWSVEREVFIPYFDEKLYTYGIHDSLSFEFEGRGIAIVFSYGKSSGKIEYSIDGGEWQEYAYERYWWVPEENFTNAVKFADDLKYGKHTFSLRVTHGDKEGFTSSDCKVLKIFAVK